MTFGAGGHTKAILEANPGSVVYALDRDPKAFSLAQKLALEFPYIFAISFFLLFNF